MRRNLVTGATGFIGSHVVRALLDRKEEVRCLVRPGRRRDALASLGVELATGELDQRESLVDAARGCDAVFHCAADYRLFARRPAELYVTNVGGTENVLSVCAQLGVSSVVYTSSVATMGPLVGHYKRSKFLAEEVALAWYRRGLPVVIVNPSTPVGEGDGRPTPTGRIIVDFLAGRMPAYVDTGLNLIDVRDVAAGHVLARDRGTAGARYLLAHRNMTLAALLAVLSEISGRPAPRLELPHFVPLVWGAIDTLIARALDRTPRVPLEAVRMSRKKMFFDGTPSARALGLSRGPVEPALARAVAWFRTHRYV